MSAKDEIHHHTGVQATGTQEMEWDLSMHLAEPNDTWPATDLQSFVKNIGLLRDELNLDGVRRIPDVNRLLELAKESFDTNKRLLEKRDSSVAQSPQTPAVAANRLHSRIRSVVAHHQNEHGVPLPHKALRSAFKAHFGEALSAENANVDAIRHIRGVSVKEIYEHPRVWRTELCWWHSRQPGSCTFGTRCNYAHGESEIVTAATRPKQIVLFTDVTFSADIRRQNLDELFRGYDSKGIDEDDIPFHYFKKFRSRLHRPGLNLHQILENVPTLKRDGRRWSHTGDELPKLPMETANTGTYLIFNAAV